MPSIAITPSACWIGQSNDKKDGCWFAHNNRLFISTFMLTDMTVGQTYPNSPRTDTSPLVTVSRVPSG